MSIDDRAGVAEFVFPREVVFRGLEEAVKQTKGMKVAESSHTGGFLNVKTGASALSWGENVTLNVHSAGEWRTTVSVVSEAKSQLGTSGGRNKKNVRTLLSITAALLDENGNKWANELGIAPASAAAPQAAPAASVSTADELKKLAELKEQGILTAEEFAEQKARLLGS